jgi:hypothetical protein
MPCDASFTGRILTKSDYKSAVQHANIALHQQRSAYEIIRWSKKMRRRGRHGLRGPDKSHIEKL